MITESPTRSTIDATGPLLHGEPEVIIRRAPRPISWGAVLGATALAMGAVGGLGGGAAGRKAREKNPRWTTEPV
ncbi:MAG TPA: hypothetical protein VG797_09895 [Phycisphaerales bacterium]|nr:hypothetical protein [Phycisphaerales bacterium]